MKNKSAIVKEMYIGACEKKKIKSLFSSGVIFLAFVAILISIVLLLFMGTVAKLLGATFFSIWERDWEESVAE